MTQALIYSETARNALQEHYWIKLSTYGIMFMGTPHQGSSGASLADILLNVASICLTTDNKLLKHLQPNSEYLQQQLRDYGPISKDFATIFAYEMFPTRMPFGKQILVSGASNLQGANGQVVPQASAIVPGSADAERIAVQADHIKMVKFASRDDGGYRKVSGHLRLLARAAPDAIATRWTEADKMKG